MKNFINLSQMTNSTHQTRGAKQSADNQPYWIRLTALWLMISVLTASFSSAWAESFSILPQNTTVSSGSGALGLNPIKGPIDILLNATDVVNGAVGRPICKPLADSCNAKPLTPEQAKAARDAHAKANKCVFLQDTCKKTPIEEDTKGPASSSPNMLMKLWDGITTYITDGYEFAKGMVLGLIQQIKDIWDLVTNPVEVAEGLYQLGKALISHPKDTIDALKTLLSKAAQDTLTQATQCGAYDQGYLIGSYVSPAVALKVLSKLGKLSKYTGKIDDVIKATKKEVGCASFTAGTLIQTPQGNKAIEAVVAGNEVYSRDDQHMRDSVQTVTKTFGRIAPSYRLITTEQEVVYVTDEHPLWVQGKGWTPAKEIKEDDVVAARQGDMLILENSPIAKSAQVYNFSVYRTHSYFVGEAGLWAHNTFCDLVMPRKAPISPSGFKIGASDGGKGKWAVANRGVETPQSKYETQITGAPHNVEYEVNGVKFDGYDSQTKVLLDAKNYTNNNPLVKGFPPSAIKGIQDDLLDQARRQIAVAGSNRIEWVVSNQKALDAIKTLFSQNGDIGSRIEFVFAADIVN
jgi:hypothetical protein